MRCPECGYELPANLDEPCPECGIIGPHGYLKNHQVGIALRRALWRIAICSCAPAVLIVVFVGLHVTSYSPAVQRNGAAELYRIAIAAGYIAVLTTAWFNLSAMASVPSRKTRHWVKMCRVAMGSFALNAVAYSVIGVWAASRSINVLEAQYAGAGINKQIGIVGTALFGLLLLSTCVLAVLLGRLCELAWPWAEAFRNAPLRITPWGVSTLVLLSGSVVAGVYAAQRGGGPDWLKWLYGITAISWLGLLISTVQMAIQATALYQRER